MYKTATRDKTGAQLLLEGLDKALSKYGPDMARAELVADYLAMDGSVITADDVRIKFEEVYERPLKVGNALGGLFRHKQKWEFVGFVHSKRPQSHYRMIRTWRRRPAEKRETTPPEVGTENGVRFCHQCMKDTEHCTCQDL